MCKLILCYIKLIILILCILINYIHYPYSTYTNNLKWNVDDMTFTVNKINKQLLWFTELTKAVIYEETLTALLLIKHRLSPYNVHYLNYHFFTQFSVPVPYEYEI